MARGKIIYPIVPSRLSDEVYSKCLDFIRLSGNAPLDHRRGMPFKDFEDKIGRKRTLEFMIREMQPCDQSWLFGISDGAMGELGASLDMRDLDENREIRCVYGYDPEWEIYYERLRGKYGDLIARLRGGHRAIVLVGPRAIGKTFWIKHLLRERGEMLGRIKTTTTRTPEQRDKKDGGYKFISVEEFQHGITLGDFLEHDFYKGNYYGSSMEPIRKTLKTRDGIMAITPKGVAELWKRRFEVNLSIVLLRASRDVLIQNYVRRGIEDPVEQERLWREELDKFSLSTDVKHEVVDLSGSYEKDHDRIFEALGFKE